MDAADRYMWVAFIGVTCLNAAIWWRRGQQEVATRPELAEGYSRLVWGLVLLGNLPWIVMGAGITFGGVPGVDSFLAPPESPFVTAFHFTVVGLWVALARWVLWSDGAEQLASHPGLMNLSAASPRAIKWLIAASLVGGVVAMACVLTGSGPGQR